MKSLLRKRILIPLVLIFAVCLLFIGKTASAYDTSRTVTATINYYYYDEDAKDNKGTRPYPAFVANMPVGSSSITEKSPVLPGYSATQSTVTVTFDEDSVTDVFYKPSNVPYVIRLYTQDLSGDGYTVSDIINGEGLTGTEPAEFSGDTLENKYEGFTLMYHVPDTIAADGSTEFECYYDRNYYLMDVELGSGGYGVESVYAKYGSSFSLGTPVRAGYVFKKWKITKTSTGETVDEIPATVPAYDLKFTAVWEKASDTTYRVVYKNADLNSGGATTYSYWGSVKINASPDTQIDLSTIISDYSDKISGFTDYKYFTYDDTATKANNPEKITVAGDGSTTVTLYYSRNVYTIRYVYARQAVSSNSLAASSTIKSGNSYIIVNSRSSTAALSSTSSSGRLAMNTFSESSSTNWKITKCDDGTYTIMTDGKYLTFASGTASLTSTETKITLTYDESDKVWILGLNSQYLNDYQGSGTSAAGWKEIDAGSKWLLYDVTEKTYVEKLGSIQLASSTSNGKYSNISWGHTASALPEIDTLNGKLQTGTVLDENGSYKLYYISLTAEYGADIEDMWPSRSVNPTSDYYFGSWAAEYGSEYRNKDSEHANIVGPYPTMSSELIIDPTNSIAETMYAWWGTSGSSISEHNYKIYYEVLPDETADVIISGVGYKLNRTLSFPVAHNGSTRIDPFVYTGCTIIDSEKGGYGDSTNATYSPQDSEGIYITSFHYTRNRHTLTYYNYNSNYETDTDTTSIMYGESLTDYNPGTPTYPDSLPEGKYEFAGWYTSDVYDTEFDWDSAMPDSDVMVYAYWKPKTYTVNFYNDESAYLNGEASIDSVEASYGSTVNSSKAESALTAPQFESGDSMENAEQAGWFYYDEDGDLHAFEPKAMNVTGNMNLFMTWTTTVPTYFAVHYYITGTKKEVAEDTTGYSFVGLTRTFKAKTESDLSEGYREHYFPDRDSTSILMKSSSNEAAFYYTYMDKVAYTVKYIDADTGETLLDEKVVADNSKAVVTEKYVPVEGYIPTSYYISLTLTVKNGVADDEHNVITFYYSKDSTNMLYHVKYLLEDEDGTYRCENSSGGEVLFDGESLLFKETNYIDAVGQIGSVKNVSVISYSGYTASKYQIIDYVKSTETAISDPVKIEDGTSTVSLSLDSGADSREIYIYYTKNEYNLKVAYEIESSDTDEISAWYEALSEAMSDGEKLVPDSSSKLETDGGTVYTKYYRISENMKFGSAYTITAPTLDGYLFAGTKDKSIVISDDDDSYSKNSVTFTYTVVKNVMFYYKAIFPDGGGSKITEADDRKVLSVNQESVEIGVRPEYEVTAQLESDNYVFVGWYRDSDCTEPVSNNSAGDVITGDGSQTLKPLGSNADTTYYAKYDYKRGGLVISNEFSDGESEDGSQAYEFVIKGADDYNSWIEIKVCIFGEGSKTVQGLPIGSYTVTQSSWSWRYESESTAGDTLTVDEDNVAEVTFTQAIVNTKWLDGNAYKDNVFAAAADSSDESGS